MYIVRKLELYATIRTADIKHATKCDRHLTSGYSECEHVALKSKGVFWLHDSEQLVSKKG